MVGDLVPFPLLPACAADDHGSKPFLVKLDGIWIHLHLPAGPIEWDRHIDHMREERTRQIRYWRDLSGGAASDATIDGTRESFYGRRVPTVSIFFGIEIRMYFRDHAPPHFHAFYHDNEALISIEMLEVIRGALPRRALGLVLDWAELHRGELMENWKRAQQHLDLSNIDPLE